MNRDKDWQITIVYNYLRTNPDSVVRLTFNDDETYLCTFSGLSVDDNVSEVEEATGVIIEADNLLYQDYYQLSFELSSESPRGKRNYNKYLEIDRRDFPAKITDTTSGEVVYSDSK